MFDDHAIARAAASAIEDPRLWRKSELLAWVLMPDHWHGIVHAEAEPLSCTVQRLKCNVGREVNLARTATGPVWNPAFHDRGLRSERMQLAMARYIVMNPVRAGLVDRPGMYPYWNSVWL